MKLGQGMFILWLAMSAKMGHWPGPGWLPLLLPVTGAASAVLFLAHSVVLAQLAVVLTAVLLSSVIADRYYPSTAGTRGLLAAWSILLPGLLGVGYFYTYSDVPAAGFLAIGYSPVLLMIGVFKPVRSMRAARRWAVMAFVLALPLAFALILALRAQPMDSYP